VKTEKLMSLLGVVVLSAGGQSIDPAGTALSRLMYHTAWIHVGEWDTSTRNWATAKECVVTRARSDADRFRVPKKGDRLACAHPQQLAITDFGRSGEARRHVPPTSGKISNEDLVGWLAAGEVVDVCAVYVEPTLPDLVALGYRLQSVYVRVGNCDMK